MKYLLEAKRQLVKKHSSKPYKNLINKLIRINKTNSYKSFLGKHKNVSKRTLDGIRSIINAIGNSEKQVKCIKINDEVETSPKILADSFNNFFVLNAKNIDKKIIHANAS